MNYVEYLKNCVNLYEVSKITVGDFYSTLLIRESSRRTTLQAELVSRHTIVALIIIYD